MPYLQIQAIEKNGGSPYFQVLEFFVSSCCLYSRMHHTRLGRLEVTWSVVPAPYSEDFGVDLKAKGTGTTSGIRRSGEQLLVRPHHHCQNQRHSHKEHGNPGYRDLAHGLHHFVHILWDHLQHPHWSHRLRRKGVWPAAQEDRGMSRPRRTTIENEGCA